MKYSVAIRTLGKSPDTLRRELESLHRQTVRPEKIVIYIAEGFPQPDFLVGMEEYVAVRKGMLTQRALRYDEVDTEYLLLLDDDVEFEADSLERLLGIMEKERADCVACDTFENHKMSLYGKVRAALCQLVFPHFDSGRAFRIHSNGSFSYIFSPKKSHYPSMSAAGPAALWRKSSFLKLHVEDELWLDNLGFAYGEDVLTFFKLFVSGGRLFVAFDCGINNLDAKTSSGTYHGSAAKFRIMGKAQKILWHRMIYSLAADKRGRFVCRLSFGFKVNWLRMVLALISISPGYRRALAEYNMGIREAEEFINSDTYRELPPYKVKL